MNTYTPPAAMLSETQAQLFAACLTGQVEKVKEALEAGADPSHNQSECFVWACQQRHEDVAKVLLEHGALASDQNNKALMFACSFSNVFLADLILHHPSFNPNVGMGDVLMEVSTCGSVEVLELLLKKQPYSFKSLCNALQKSLGHNNDELAAFLVSNHVNVYEWEGRTPYHFGILADRMLSMPLLRHAVKDQSSTPQQKTILVNAWLKLLDECWHGACASAPTPFQRRIFQALEECASWYPDLASDTKKRLGVFMSHLPQVQAEELREALTQVVAEGATPPKKKI